MENLNKILHKVTGLVSYDFETIFETADAKTKGLLYKKISWYIARGAKLLNAKEFAIFKAALNKLREASDLNTDVNKDGTTDEKDVEEIKKHMGETVDDTNKQYDVNKDGKIDKGDIKVVEEQEIALAIAAIGDKIFDSLAKAWNSIGENETVTITLLDDARSEGLAIINPAIDVPANKNITLDLNGHTFTCIGPAVGSTGTISQALHLEQGNKVTIKNGTVEVDKEKAESENLKMLVQNYSDLVLDNVVLDGNNLIGQAPYTLSNNFGNVVVKNKSSILAGEGHNAFDLWYGMNPQGVYDKGISVTFDSTFIGKVEGNIEYGFKRIPEGKTLEDIIDVCKLTINNGDFTGVPEFNLSSSQEGFTKELVRDLEGVVITNGRLSDALEFFTQKPEVLDDVLEEIEETSTGEVVIEDTEKSEANVE